MPPLRDQGLPRRYEDTFVVLAATAVLLGAAPESAQEQVLGTAGSAPSIEAVAMPCANGHRALRVRRANAKRTATMSEPYGQLTCDVAKASEPGWDWSGGKESSAWDLRLRAVDLKGGPKALLITQRLNFEYVHQQHALFLTDAAGITRAWEGVESSGPATSSVDVQGGRILFSHTVDLGDGDLADTWALSELGWDAARKKVTERPAEAWAIILGTETSVIQARAAEARMEAECNGATLLTVDTNEFPRLPQGRWVVASFLTSRKAADTALERLRACAPGASLKRVQ
ncbi:hypothetical protein [Corallococcus sp. RDP092CA]|uniref:hypothetical protein n=1 Tax=Corallococcus sp. RDP092CA TaxID=3109369 RepID=UPI0035B34E1B